MFQSFSKISRLSRDVTITEKIDGTNAQVHIVSDTDVSNIGGLSFDLVETFKHFKFGDHWILPASRNHYVTRDSDNYGFALWVSGHLDELFTLGEGRHYGEWWGAGIQRRYGLSHKRFSLFNTVRCNDDTLPACCSVVPILYRGPFCTIEVEKQLGWLQQEGSVAAPGFMNPEGIVVYHTGANIYFKKTLKGDKK